MTQPVPYAPEYSFTDFSSGSPTSQPPGTKLDAEFEAIEDTLAAVLRNLAIMQRDDGGLANGSVGVEQLSAAVISLVGQSTFAVRGQWLTATAYAAGDFYSNANQTYIVMVAHNSSSITSDVAAGKVVGPVFYPDSAQLATLTAALALTTGAATIGTSTGATVEARLATLSAFDASLSPATGAALVGASDSSGGTLWTTIQGFITKLLSSAGAATIGFIQSGVGAVAETIQAALRREVWADQYKQVGDPDDVLCVTRAVTALLASSTSGGVVRLSRRSYIFGSTVTFTSLNNVRIIGAGKFSSGTMIRETFAAGDAFNFVGCAHSGIEEVMFWPTVRKTSGFSVTLTNSCFSCFVDFRTDYGWNGLGIEGATETRFKVKTRYMLGTIGAWYAGNITHKSYRAICEDMIADNPYPLPASATNAKTWANGMTLVAGDHFEINGAVYQATVGGVAGGSAPTGYPTGTTPESVFTGTIASGAATLKWVSNSALAHLVMDNYAYSLVIDKAALLNGNVGFTMIDSANTGSSYPIWAFANDLETDHSRALGLNLDRGEGFFDIGGCWIGSCLTGNGVTIGSNFRGEVSFGPGSRIMGNAQHGVLRQAGAIDVRLTGVACVDNGVKGPSGTYHGLRIAGLSVDTQIVGGRYGDSVSVAGNLQGWGISIGASCDKTTISGAVVRGNATGTIDVGATQTNLHIADCPGYSPGALTSITVTASPFTYTNSTGSDTSVNVVGGTVSAITLDTHNVASATNQQVLVPRGSAVVVTYTVAPTMLQRIL